MSRHHAVVRLSARMRALLLATSAGQRARLILPTEVLSGVEFPVTSKYTASLSSGESCEFGTRVSFATAWKGACASFHSTLAFSIQKSASRRLPQYVILSVSRSCTATLNPLIFSSSFRCRINSSCSPFGLLFCSGRAGVTEKDVAEYFTTSLGP